MTFSTWRHGSEMIHTFARQRSQAHGHLRALVLATLYSNMHCTMHVCMCECVMYIYVCVCVCVCNISVLVYKYVCMHVCNRAG